jgi:hypothetical protein
MIARQLSPRRFTPAILLAVLITVSTVAISQPVSAAGCTNPYTVVSGDSFYRIAIKMGVPESKRADYVAQILWINHNPKVIHPGDKLCLPPTASTPEPKPRREWSREEVEKIIRKLWPDMSEGIALAVVERESHLNPYSHSGTCCYGLFQIYWEVHKVRASALHRFLDGKGEPGPHILYSPRFNTLLALQMYRQGGWAPWCSSSGFPVSC